MSSINPVQTCFISCLFTKWQPLKYIYIRKQFFQKNLVSKNIDILKSLEEKIIILWERDEEDLGFSGSSVVKDLPANAQV